MPQSVSCQLDRIADAMSGFDWNTFVATLIATIIGALVAAFIGLAVARAERPQPFFRVETDAGHGGWHVYEGEATLVIEVWNIGDGTAYNLEVAGPGVSKPDRVAALAPGESIRSGFRVPASGKTDYDPLTDNMLDSRQVEWDPASAVRLRWQQPPRRHRVRSQRISLSNPLGH